MPVFKHHDIFAGRYLLEELTGEGELEQLWKAKDQLAADAEVFLKILKPVAAAAREGAEQFRNEYSASLQLSHPHLLNVEHFDLADGVPFLVMPCFSGKTLRNLLNEGVSFSERQVALLMSQAGAALENMHQHEPPLLHHEIRPENIILSRPDHFLLAHLHTSLPEERDGHAGGFDNVDYHAPEWQNMLEEKDSTADIFSLGICLYEMCTHTRPSVSVAAEEEYGPASIPAIPDMYAAELNWLIQRCLSPDKSRRPGAEELGRRAEHFLKTDSWDPAAGEKERGDSVKKTIIISLAAAVALLLIVSSFWAYKNEDLPFPVQENGETTASAEQQEDLDALLITTLEDELQQMNQKVEELKEENRMLKGEDSPASILMKNENPEQEEEPEQFEKRDELSTDRGGVERQVEILDKPEQPVAKSSIEKEAFISAEELEDQLNRISNPAIGQNQRADLKEKLSNRFAEGSIRILEKGEGAVKQFSAGIFLNLLYKVPHQIVVEEVKIDAKGRITEIQLEMQTRN